MSNSSQALHNKAYEIRQRNLIMIHEAGGGSGERGQAAVCRCRRLFSDRAGAGTDQGGCGVHGHQPLNTRILTADHANVCIRRIFAKFQKIRVDLRDEVTFLPAPGLVDSAEVRQVLVNDSAIREVIKLFGEITLALVGIGTVEPSPLLASSGNIFSNEELATLRENDAVGDILTLITDRFTTERLIQVDERLPLGDRSR